MKVLIIEDSAHLRDALAKGLTHSGYCVDVAADGAAGLAFATSQTYDVIVLDIMLPRVDGFEVLRVIREADRDTAIIILSARDHLDDRIAGLDGGADDYLTKPFAFDELSARIRTLGRRRYRVNNPLININGVTIDTSKREVRVAGSTVIPLTPSEYIIVESLAVRRGYVLSKEALHERIRRADSEATSNVVEVLVSAVRRKLASHQVDNFVTTRRGFGYVIN